MILPAKIDVNKAKANERKIEIDNGISLARQIDSLRSAFAQEKILHGNWKKSATEELKQQLEGLQEGIDAKKKELIEIEEQRRKLIEPLDLEWQNLRYEQSKFVESKNEFFLDQERHQEESSNLDQEKTKVAHSLKRAIQNEEKTEKSLVDAQELEEMAKNRYQEASIFKIQQEDYYNQRNKEVDERYKEYEVGIKTIEIREQAVKDKESELSERETLLKDRQAMFERNIKRNHGNS